MEKLEVTKDFQTFVDGIFINNYVEIYDLCQAANGNEECQTTFIVEECRGSDDILIIYKPTNNAIRLTPKAREYFPQWIEQNLMDGLDAETYWGLEHAKEKDAEKERKCNHELG